MSTSCSVVPERRDVELELVSQEQRYVLLSRQGSILQRERAVVYRRRPSPKRRSRSGVEWSDKGGLVGQRRLGGTPWHGQVTMVEL